MDFFHAVGNNVNSSRDSLVYYHTNTDDQHWFGTDSWAVKFDFNNFFNGIDSLQFKAEGANIYIPNSASNDAMTIKLCSDYGNQPNLPPDSVLFSYTIQPAAMNFQDWNYIVFSQTFTDTLFWLVVDYHTNSSNQFISASAIDGAHSYFEDEGYYYNMLAYSFESEFLFSLQGKFMTDGNDLDLISLEWVGNIAAGEDIFPKFIVKNNSDNVVVNAYLNLEMLYPFGEIELLYNTSGEVCDSIPLPSLQPDETVIFDMTDSLKFELLPQPSQYEVTAELFCSEDSLMQNNSIELEFDTFNIPQTQVIIENAVKLNNPGSESIWTIQDGMFPDDNCKIINYFADIPDEPFFNYSSFERFHYYDLLGFPVTIVGGKRRILGYLSQNYSVTLSSFFNEVLENDCTFVSSDTCFAYYNENGDVEVCIDMVNCDTSIFYDFFDDCKLCVAVIEDVINEEGLPEDTTVPIMIDMITEVPDMQLTYLTSYCDTIEFNQLEDFETIGGELNNCRIVYWIQNNETKDIYYSNSLPFDEFTFVAVDALDEEIEQVAQKISIYPNPFKPSGAGRSPATTISFSVAENIKSANIKIYNIKGQKIKTFNIPRSEIRSQNSVTWNGKDDNSKNVSSGIYLIKIEIKTNKKTNTFLRKCVLIK